MIKLFSFIAFELLVVLLLVFLNKKYFNYRLSNFLIASISAFIFYISIIIMVFIIRYIIQKDLHSFDLNGDEFFTGAERTPELEKALRNSANDTGLTLAPITGIIFSLIYFIIILIPLNKFNKNKYKSTN
ncbi:hypothetical protein ACFX5E_00060 [Flavobacterium sp. LS2P90]|uniref:DUF4199 domain-containing protein n=1 Tax=Flavobacterium xylosi TaxID=3230415 RepID=A0ABW6HR23_9FLAO